MEIPLTSCDKVVKEFFWWGWGWGGDSETVRSHLMLAELRWKVASAYFEFIFKGQILSCFLCLPHTLSLPLFPTNQIKL